METATKYVKIKQELVSKGAKFISYIELKEIVGDEEDIFVPVMCDKCGRTAVKGELFYIVDNQELSKFAQAYGGLTMGKVDYSFIAYCGKCGEMHFLNDI